MTTLSIHDFSVRAFRLLQKGFSDISQVVDTIPGREAAAELEALDLAYLRGRKLVLTEKGMKGAAQIQPRDLALREVVIVPVGAPLSFGFRGEKFSEVLAQLRKGKPLKGFRYHVYWRGERMRPKGRPLFFADGHRLGEYAKKHLNPEVVLGAG